MKEGTPLLLPATQQTLDWARHAIGEDLVLRRVISLPNEARAMLVRSHPPRGACEIRLAEPEQPFVQHLVTHEVGHLVRLYQVAEPERLMPVIRQSSSTLSNLMAADSARLVGSGMLPEAATRLARSRYATLIFRLGSYPADLRIEQWIHDRFPRLRSLQERSLSVDISRVHGFLQPNATPSVSAATYRPTAAIAAARAYHAAALFNRPVLADPFIRSDVAELGKELVQLALTREDQGHRSDMAAVDAWAERLRIRGWFEWQPHVASL